MSYGFQRPLCWSIISGKQMSIVYKMLDVNDEEMHIGYIVFPTES